jgi:hypothetical protein
MKNRKNFTVGIVLLIVAVGSGIVFLGSGRDTVPETALSSQKTEVGVETKSISQDVENTAEENQGVVSTDTEGEEISLPTQNIVPTQRVGLQETDPGSVNLSSGDIQLIEFFAFW